LSASILEKQIGKAVRSYLKSGRNVSPAPRELSRQLLALSATDPTLAHYIEQSCRISSRLLAARPSHDSVPILHTRELAADAGR
jgi:hypothetical protein